MRHLVRVPTGRPQSRTCTSLPPLTTISVPDVAGLLSRLHFEARHARDRRQRLAAKTEARRDGRGRRLRELAGGVALEREQASSRDMPLPLSSTRM
jgi:hypothetical protein